MTFDSFLVGDSNRMSHAAALGSPKRRRATPSSSIRSTSTRMLGWERPISSRRLRKAAEAIGRKVVYLTAESSCTASCHP